MFYKKSFILFFVSACLLLFGISSVQAAATDNVSGWAWSETIGWISFNNTTGGGSVDYGVHIDLGTGLISGYAWSENIGWITFNSSQLTGCPSGACEARYNTGTHQITGWARAYRAIAPEGQSLGGWDGWIRLNGAWGSVSVDTSAGPPYYEFRGWGSGSADVSTGVVGWISFNGDNIAGGADYHVQLNDWPPTASNLQVNPPNYCVSGPNAILSWTFSDAGDSQSAYRIQVDDSSSFTSPLVYDSDKVFQSGGNASMPAGTLQYNTTYYWRLMVWDAADQPSSWINGPSFSTPNHAWPTIDFSWTPATASAGEDIQFTDESTVYGGATKSSWLWAISDATYVGGTNSTSQNPMVRFNSEGDGKMITLTVTDSDGFSCPGTKTIDVSLPLPDWQEITPY